MDGGRNGVDIMASPRNKASGIFVGDALGSVAVSAIATTVVEIAYDRFTSRATAMRSFEQVTELFAQQPALDAVVMNTLAATGHDPGNPAIGFRWAAEQRGRLRKVAIVTRSQGLLMLVGVAKAMVPWLEVRAFNTRDEAAHWCALPSLVKESQTGSRAARRNGTA